MPRIYYYDKFKICREFIIMINSDVFNLRIYYNSKFKGGAHAEQMAIVHSSANNDASPHPKENEEESLDQAT